MKHWMSFAFKPGPTYAGGGVDYAKQLLRRPGLPQGPGDYETPYEQVKVAFMFIRHADPKQLIISLPRAPADDSPGFILPDPGQAALVLPGCPRRCRRILAVHCHYGVGRRRAEGGGEGAEGAHVHRFPADSPRPAASVVDIKQGRPGHGKLILEELEKEDAELADEIRQRMFI